jgi:uncharacterized membrane protein YphA (DoxX/SURF4 family)
MSLSRRIARPLLASIFITEGLDAIRHPDPANTALATPGQPHDGSPLPREDTIPLVRLNGAVQVGGGVLLAMGKVPRLASLALIASIVPTTYAGHRFWEEPDADARNQQKMQLLKNLGLLGGLIFSAADTDGAPSVGWRTRRRVHEVATTLGEARVGSDGHTPHAASTAVETSRKAGRRAKRAAKLATRRANAGAVIAAHQAGGLAAHATRSGAELASPSVHHASEGLHEAAEGALEVAGPYISAGLERAGDFLEEALDVAGPYISAGFGRAGELLARAPHHPADD